MEYDVLYAFDMSHLSFTRRTFWDIFISFNMSNCLRFKLNIHYRYLGATIIETIIWNTKKSCQHKRPDSRAPTRKDFVQNFLVLYILSQYSIWWLHCPNFASEDNNLNLHHIENQWVWKEEKEFYSKKLCYSFASFASQWLGKVFLSSVEN